MAMAMSAMTSGGAPDTAHRPVLLAEVVAAIDPRSGDVIVDATFGHRIAEHERPAYEEAILAGEVVAPPAGAIGRGDAFILQVAAKAQATVDNAHMRYFIVHLHRILDPAEG